jgi:hypothetical protein
MAFVEALRIVPAAKKQNRQAESDRLTALLLWARTLGELSGVR